MSLFEKLNAQAEKVANFKAQIPSNALSNMMPSDGVPFMAKFEVQKLLTVERYDDETGFKSTYYVDADVAESLPKKEVSQKVLHVLQTTKNDIRFVLLSSNPSNSWNRSKLDAVKASAEGKVISVKRNKEAGVYSYSVEHDIAPFDVDMSLVAKAFDETFGGEYHIDSLEHPVAQALLENKGEFVDVVDGDTEQKQVNDDADDERVRDPSEDGIFSDDPEPLEELEEIEIEEEIDLDDLEFDDMAA
ncbi:hypothetical protein KS670_004869 [Vibrio parahaemolyticus]|uniref:hypothetical protein n=1 Tax=unclassified Vibrio TaxID=2614977 RepID=UPI00280F2B10|nr:MULTISPECIES: hypothetical protein [unclassified Vibrio]EHR0229252.1 hypothetical protein [Vibrio parahaemolyticus]HDY7455113.1 hypothetical protein [Vibrio vulnificus]ELA9876920.1 hypothetical protein [Vibrio parahaemolyticus]MBE4035225.1 hypothetical protein [Vibrio parahaemolyticus]MDW2307865.1 hypothetical protein [Vibrio sp. 1457]